MQTVQPLAVHARKGKGMSARKRREAKATVYVAEDQHEQLQHIADRSAAEGAALLRKELERAVIVAPDEAPRRFVQLNSTIEYEDLLSGKVRTVTLVAPHEADIDERRISVATPVGAALLGLVTGESFSWITQDGRPRVLTIRRVMNQP
jgi:regulator of nucleoside diphosphate kinase